MKIGGYSYKDQRAGDQSSIKVPSDLLMGPTAEGDC